MNLTNPLVCLGLLAGLPWSLRGDELAVGDPAGATPGGTALLPVTITAAQPLAGMQFDLVYTAAHGTGGLPVLEAAGGDHKVKVRQVAPGRQRAVIFSPTNAALPGDASIHVQLLLTAGAPVGGPEFAVENVKFITTGGHLVIPSPAYGAVAAWRKAHFTAAERANAAVIGDDRDGDGDGVPNLVEFASASDPKAGQPAAAPAGSTRTDAQNQQFFTFKFRQAKNLTGALMVSEVSTDLRTWTAGPAAVPTGVENATTVELGATVEVTGNLKFMRLHVLRTTAP